MRQNWLEIFTLHKGVRVFALHFDVVLIKFFVEDKAFHVTMQVIIRPVCNAFFEYKCASFTVADNLYLVCVNLVMWGHNCLFTNLYYGLCWRDSRRSQFLVGTRSSRYMSTSQGQVDLSSLMFLYYLC